MLKYLCLLEDSGNFEIILWAEANGAGGEKGPSVCQTEETTAGLSLSPLPSCGPCRPPLLFAESGDGSGRWADSECICIALVPQV